MNILGIATIPVCFLAFLAIGGSQTEKARYQIDFNSDFEAVTFERYAAGQAQLAFPLFLASSPNTSKEKRGRFDRQFRNLIAQLETKELEKKSYKRALRIIYRQVEKDLLKKYQTQVQFEDLFLDGSYNCVTASAIYALIFDHFGIPYTIKLLPHHVFLIVDPENKPIVFETTDPAYGINVISYREKHQFVEELIKKKKTDLIHKSVRNTHQLYRQHFVFTDQNITLPRLAAAQYYNNALAEVQAEQYESALNNTEKSAYLYPTNRNNYLQMLCLYQLVKSLDYNDPESFTALFKLYHLNVSREMENEIHHHFFQLSEKLLFEQPDTTLFDHYFSLFAEATRGHPIEKEIQTVYYMQKAKAASLQFDYAGAQAYICRAYQLSPANLRIKRILTEIILEQFQFEHTADHIDLYLERYPFLREHPQIVELQAANDVQLWEQRALFPFYGIYFWPTANQQKRSLLPQLKGRLKIDPNYELFRKALKDILRPQDEIQLLTRY